MKIKCNLDQIKYQAKPEGFEIGKITNRLEISQVEIELEELMKQIVNGCTFKPALLNGKKESDWVQQQIFALDFDNDVELLHNKTGKKIKRDETIELEEQYIRDNCYMKKDNRTTIEEQFDIARENNILPIFAYHSFSSIDCKPKFRFVFCSENTITDFDECKQLQIAIMNIFDKSDEKCKDLGRLYFGGKKLIYEDFNNRIDSINIINKYKIIENELKSAKLDVEEKKAP